MSAMSFVVGRWLLGAAVIAALGCGPAARAASLGTRAVDPAPAGSAPLLMGTMGETALAGRVLATDGTPLRAVSIVDGAARTQTDDQGRFLLPDLPAGESVLVLDGRHAVTAAEHGPTDYGYYEVRVEAAQGATTQLPWVSWLPRIDHSHDVTIASPATEAAVVTTPAIPGLELRIPAGAVITDPDGQPVTHVGITAIPVNRPPFPLPANVAVPIYFTAQPGGATIASADGSWLGAQVVYPNYNHELPRARGTFWRYEPDGLGWTTYGTGSVQADGRQVVPDPGTRIYALTGAMFNTIGLNPPSDGPTSPGPGGNPKSGDPIDLSSGLFVQTQTDLIVQDVVPLSLTRTYQSDDFNSRSFGVGMSMVYDTFLWSSDQYQVADLVSPDGSRVHYTRIPEPGAPGDNGWITAHFTTTTPGPYYQSQMSWNGNGWNLVRQDGTLLVYGENAPLQAVVDRYGNRITITRSDGVSGNITQVSSPNGRFITFAYNANNCVTQATDNIGRTVTYTYDSSSRLTTVTDPDGGVTTYTWDSSNRVQSIKDARLNTFLTNTYDSNDRVLTQTLPDGTSYSFGYTLGGSGSGGVTETDVTDPRSVVRKVTFNAAGYTLTDKRAYGTAQEVDLSWTRDSVSNLPLSMTDGLGRTTNWVYDANGNVTSVTRLAGTANAVTTSYAYGGAFNTLTSITDPLGHVTTITRNALGEATSIADALGHTTGFTYNSAGQVATIADPLGQVTTLGYFGPDLASVTDPLLRTATFYTDAIGRRVRATDPLGNLALTAYDPIDGVHQATDPNGSTTTISYDADGNVASVVDARSGSTSYTYDARGRLTVRTDPLGHADDFTSYDGNGNLLTATDRKSQAVTKTYDPLNRLSSVSYADGSTLDYTWDAASRLTQVVDSVGGTVSRVYDGLDRLTSETTPQGTVSYTYDAAGRRASMTVPNQSEVTYSYDNADRLTGIAQGSATTTIAYDNANRRSSLTLPNGIVATYATDAASQLTAITYTSGATTIGTLSYGYDLAGRIVSRGGTLFQSVLPAAVTSATYDAANRLTARTAAGSTVSPTWDLNGNLLTDGLHSYSWDSRNRLTTITGVASYVYDAFGRRRTNTLGTAATAYLYDGGDSIQEQNASGSVTANLLTGAGIDKRFTRATTGTGAATSSYLTDALGSAVALASSSGTVRTNDGYDPYGATGTSGTANTSPYPFTGRENDGTGLYFYRARYYNPVWGRFISEDPIGLNGGINRYRYADNNPVSFTDPSGNCPACAVFAIEFAPEIGEALAAAYKAATAWAGSGYGAATVGGLLGGSVCQLTSACTPPTQPTPMASQPPACPEGAVCASSGDPAPNLTRGGRKVLGNLNGTGIENQSVTQAILSRGGSGSNVNAVATNLRQSTVSEVANDAPQGDAPSLTAIKIIKQAGRLGQRND